MDKWKKVLGLREIEMQCELPKGYGIVYRRYWDNTIIAYPIPFNWLLWLFREIHFFLIRVPNGAVEKAYKRGFVDGKNE